MGDKSRLFSCLTFDWSRGYGEEKNPLLPGIRHSRENSSVEGSQRARKIVTYNRHFARENASDRVVTGFNAAFDWLRGWHEFSGPITARGKAKPIIDYFLSLNQRGSKWQVSNLLQFPLRYVPGSYC